MDADRFDLAILRELQGNGRISNANLARRVHLSPPAVHARVRRLERDGVIRQYTALLDGEKVGYDMLCFVHLSLQRHQPRQVRDVREALEKMPEVLECYHVTGEHDYLLKVVIRNRKDLDRFVVEQLTPVPGIARVHTSIALNEVKSTTVLPLGKDSTSNLEDETNRRAGRQRPDSEKNR
jgi:DNA-binding Lrp family transcriptional regulator